MARLEPAFLDYRCPWPNTLPPGLAGDLAFRRFCTPKLSPRRSSDHKILVARARFHLRGARHLFVETVEGPIDTYVFEPDPGSELKGSVLISHGWTSEASFMAVLCEQLRRAGFRVIGFDQPAHGRSRREHASLIDCARALRAIATALGPIRFVLGHSMGCLAALLVGEGAPPFPSPYPFERYVLISGPNKLRMVTHEFAVELGLSARAERHFERQLERLAHRPLVELTAANLLGRTERPALVLHAPDDREVSLESALEITAACPRARLHTLDGLGHRNILYAPAAIRTAIAYLSAA